MRFRKLTADGDWIFGHGSGDIVEGESAIEFEVATRIREWYGDWFADMTRGIDYTNLLEVGQKANLLYAIRATILSCYGVIGVTKVDCIFTDETGQQNVGRNLHIQYSIDTIYKQGFQAEISL
jgi:hypothetical protein